MKKFIRVNCLAMALLMMFTLIFTGCNKKEETTKTQDTTSITSESDTVDETTKEEATKPKWDTTKNTKIILATVPGLYESALKQVAKDYTALHPETTVEIEILEGGAYGQTINTKLNADKKTAPDIVHANLLTADDSDYVKKGYFKTLDEMLDEPNPYNENKQTREAIDAGFLSNQMNAGGSIAKLPFDLVGLGVYYNQDIFDKLGLKAPSTYGEMTQVCDKLKEAGYKYPIGATGFLAWMTSSLADSIYSKYAEQMVTLPGDGRWNESSMAENLNVKYSDAVPTFDAKAIFDPEKKLLLRKSFDRKSETSKKYWEIVKKIGSYGQQGWVSGADGGQLYSQFLAQQIPILIDGSWNVPKLFSDIAKLPTDKQFKWSVFKFLKSEEFPGNVRGLLTPGNLYGIVNKEDDDTYYRASDFMKYIYSPTVAAKIFDTTIQKGEMIQGPSLIEGVKINDEILSALEGFKVEGSMRWEYNDLEMGAANTEDTPKWNTLFTKWIEGKATWEQFVEEKEKYIQANIKSEAEKNNYDLDPKTLDEVKK